MDELDTRRKQKVGRRCSLVPSCLAVVLSVMCCNSASGVTVLPSGNIPEMQALVRRAGIPDLLRAAGRNGWRAPIIRSSWHVQQVCPEEERTTAVAARRLGSLVLDRIDRWAPLMQTSRGSELFHMVRDLVDLAYWLGTTHGYGNLILAGRARDVAVSGLGVLVADISFPLAEPALLLRRFDAPFDAPSVRSQVLNDEAGKLLFNSSTITDTILQDTWNNYKALRVLNTIPPSDIAAGTEESRLLVKQMRHQLMARGLDADTEKKFGNFLDDQQCPAPGTTRNCWDFKRHEQFVTGFRDPRVEAVRALAQFRRVIGVFPLTPTKRRDSSLSEVEEAFSEAWDPHIGNATTDLGLRAAAVFEQIRSGKFVDWDTLEVATAGAQIRGTLSSVGTNPVVHQSPPSPGVQNSRTPTAPPSREAR